MRITLLSLFLLAGGAHADCAREAAMHLVFPRGLHALSPVKSGFRLDQKVGILHAHFDVDAHRPILAPPKLKKYQHPFQFDVVEIFVSVAGAKKYPYHEIEVSPFGQTFEVYIDTNKVFHNDVKSGAVAHASRAGTAWSVDVDIPLGNLGWDGDPKNVVGGAFATLGGTKQRAYWSVDLPPTPPGERPNFHQPDQFTNFCAP